MSQVRTRLGIRGAVLFVVLAMITALLQVGAITPVGAAAGDIEGTVFRDVNHNGVQDAGEPGVAGIEVASDDGLGGTTGPVITDADGRYVLTPSGAAATYRVEFTIPAALSFLEHGPLPDAATAGTIRSRSSVQVAAPNGPLAAGDAGVDFGVVNPADFCEDSPGVAVTCFLFGDNLDGEFSAEATVLSYDFDHTAPEATEAVASETGTTYGVAWHRQTETMLISAYMKRHAGFGPGSGAGTSDGTGTIYAVSGGSATPWVDLDDLFGAGTTGADPHPDGQPATVQQGDWFWDAGSWDAVGKISLGDMDISDDDSTVYVTNLANQTVYALPVGADGSAPAAADVTTHPVPAMPGCTAGDSRPFGLGFNDGVLYVGSVCSGETGGVGELAGGVFAMNVAAGETAFSATPVLSFPMVTPKAGGDYYHGCAQYYPPRADTTDYFTADFCGTAGGLEGAPGDYNAWSPVFTFYPDNDWNNETYPQPIITDIEFDGADLLLGVRDRAGDQFGWLTGSTDTSDPDAFVTGAIAGDVLRGCASGTGWVIEDNGSCPDGRSTAGADNLEGPGGGEWFHEEVGPNSSGQEEHRETSLGAIAVHPARGEVMITAMDVDAFYDNGTLVFDAATGTQRATNPTYAVFTGNVRETFAKGNGLGDIELQCAAAPVQIGNYVWFDRDGDGIQDPDEEPIPGATVTLSDGQVVTTDASGYYVFWVDPNTTYTIGVDVSTADVSGIPDVDDPAALIPTTQDAGADTIDSDINTDLEMTVTTGGPGQNDHTLDAGFNLARFDLALRKQIDDGTNLGVVSPGDSVTFTLTVFNQGNVDAVDVAVVDYIPTGLSLDDADWTGAGGVATLDVPIPFLAAGDSTTVDITFTVDADAIGTIDNFAEISDGTAVDDTGEPILDAGGDPLEDVDSTPDATDGNDNAPTTGGDPTDDVVDEDGRAGGDEDDHDVASLSVDVPVFDLALRKTLAAGQAAEVTVGDAVTFTIEVINQGDIDAANIEITDYVPAGMVLADADWTDNGDGTATYNTLLSLAVGESTTIDVTMTVNGNVTGQIVNWAEISDATDADGDDVTDIDSTPNNDIDDDNQPDGPGEPGDDVVDENGKSGGDEDDHDPAGVDVGIFDLALQKNLNAELTTTIEVGSDVVWTITVTNEGTVDAENVEVSDYLPAELTLNDPAWTDNGDSTATYNTLLFIPVGGSVTIDIITTLTQSFDGRIINVAEITSDDDDDVDSTPDNEVEGEDDQDDDGIEILGGQLPPPEDPPDDEEIPDTGINSDTGAGYALMLIGSGALLVLTARDRRLLN